VVELLQSAIDEEVLEVLVRLVDGGVAGWAGGGPVVVGARAHITRCDTRIIVMTLLGGAGTESTAAAIGIHDATLRCARNRAERALTAFARADRRGEVA